MKTVMPMTDWSTVNLKPVISSFLRRLDKMMSKILKSQRIYMSIDWKAVSNILEGEEDSVYNNIRKQY